ncbi:MAG TPA: hypothetical protein VF602_04840 [Pedobacter sp.]
MKTLLLSLSLFFFLAGCTKDESVNPYPTKQFKVSFVPSVSNNFSTDWQQVLGGKASLEFNAKTSDTLSSSALKDTIELKTITTYRKQLATGKYDIMLKTQSTAAADTFIRFTAEVKDFQVKAEGAISLAATTVDGVLTINKSLIEAGSRPTFIPAGSTTALSFGLANGYYFVYVKGGESGKLTFTEAGSGDEFMKNLTITAMTRYNLVPTRTSKAPLVFNLNRFSLKSLSN